MKTYLNLAFAIVITLLPFLQACELITDFIDDNNNPHYNKDSIKTSFIPNQLLVIYKNQPTAEHAAKIAQAIKDSIPDARLDQVCSSCDSYVELWKGTDIHTIIHGEGIASGSTRGNKPVGEDTLAWYSLNFTSNLPFEDFPKQLQFPPNQFIPDTTGKDKIVIAVIDTGIDSYYIRDPYIWKNRRGTEASSDCYPENIQGWNFLNNTEFIRDDNNNRHGTMVSQYIINQFMDSPTNLVQIMGLKTFDSEGNGDLFHNICAIHFAMENGANIINASWGSYYYEEEVHPYMKHLITNKLKEKGILFITAAGNKIEAVDARAVALDLVSARSLRDLDFHHFFPAYLSDASNNVITVTTTDGLAAISLTQNYSNNHVDLGVVCDTVTPEFMRFRLPFAGTVHYVSGSSFATAIATGKIGAYFPKNYYSLVRDMPKQELMNVLSGINEPDGAPLIVNNIALRNFLREGRFIIK